MTGSISRKLCQRLLLLYPKPFRDEFGDEMLSIFEPCRGAQGCCRVFADIFLSATKQQIHCLSTPVPKSASFYSDIGSSPNLARMLAVAAFGAGLLASVFVGRRPEAPEFSTAARSEALFWFPTAGWDRYCSDLPLHTETATSFPAAGVLVARKRQDPTSWRMARIGYGQYWSVVPELTGKPKNVLTAQAGQPDGSKPDDLRTTPK